ncbi:family 4B encapsulin nanocompartment shell protein [Thermococcus henrietii]|uniref:family 4B encapsulin nanocompartment shell protein n=1 Tax=Thermococcus henrietii TaxID=2016361 RepID=UPI000C0847F3|nr:family 4B encapsulin nanocompartment shell protein [Thermococcus henrietii]
MKEIGDVVVRAIEELKNEGMNPDIMLAGPGFIEHTREFLTSLGLRIYRIEELGYDAVIADSAYLGQIKKASRRISVEPFLEEKRVWEEIEKLDV